MEPTPAGTPEAAGPVVTDNPARSRFELHVGAVGADGARELAGSVSYHLNGHVINLIHTEVDPRFQGAGYAALLAKASLDAARERHLAVLPTCPYIRSWISRHPGYADLVPEERRAGFGL